MSGELLLVVVSLAGQLSEDRLFLMRTLYKHYLFTGFVRNLVARSQYEGRSNKILTLYDLEVKI